MTARAPWDSTGLGSPSDPTPPRTKPCTCKSCREWRTRKVVVRATVRVTVNRPAYNREYSNDYNVHEIRDMVKWDIEDALKLAWAHLYAGDGAVGDNNIDFSRSPILKIEVE